MLKETLFIFAEILPEADLLYMLKNAVQDVEREPTQPNKMMLMFTCQMYILKNLPQFGAGSLQELLEKSKEFDQIRARMQSNKQ